MSVKTLFLVSTAILSLASCATVPMAAPDADSAAKQFGTIPDKARIYVVRASSVGTAILFQTSVDDRIIGSLPVHTYLVTEVSPGPHTITAVGGENESSVSVN